MTPEDKPKDYGRCTLNKHWRAIDSHDIVMIFAGYPKEMASFFSINAGLHRTIPFRLIFSNYAREDLCQIFRAMMAKYKYRVDDEWTIEEAFSHVDVSQ